MLWTCTTTVQPIALSKEKYRHYINIFYYYFISLSTVSIQLQEQGARSHWVLLEHSAELIFQLYVNICVN